MTNKNHKRVLIITYYFPPAATTGVIRIAKFIEYLQKYDWEPIVITSNDRGLWFDPTLLKAMNSDLKVYRVKTVYSFLGKFLNKAYRGERGSNIQNDKKLKEMRKTEKGTIFDKLKRNLRELFVPEPVMIFWSPFAVIRAIHLMRRFSIDLIWASGGPWSNCLTAMFIGQLFGKPVVSDFRDVWALGPPNDNRSKWRKWWDYKLEKLVVAKSSAVTAVQESMVKDLYERYSKILRNEKVFYLPHGFDRLYSAQKKMNKNNRKNSKIVFLYTGQMGRYRTAKFFLQAVNKGLKSNLIREHEIKIKFVGFEEPDLWGKTLRDYIEKYNLQNVVKKISPIPYYQALKMHSSADVLLVFKGIGEAQVDGALSSKIITYLGANRPILALAPEWSAICKFIDATKSGICAEPEDIDNILDKIIYFINTRGNNIKPRIEEVEKYSVKKQVEKLVEIFNSVLK